jgi:hypothetical protein
LAGILSRDKLKGAGQNKRNRVIKLPGYAKGGLNLDYLYEIVLNDKDITSDMTFYMHNTQNFPVHKEINEKYTNLLTDYLLEKKLEFKKVEI